MSIQNTAELVALARKEGMREAAKVVERIADTITKQAERANNDERFDDVEELELIATWLNFASARVKRAASRKPRR